MHHAAATFGGSSRGSPSHPHTLTPSQGNVFESDWKNGLSIGPGAARGELTFPDGLVYGEKDWDYCSHDDRRFYSERVNGLQPAGRSQLTDKGTFWHSHYQNHKLRSLSPVA